MLNPSQVLAFAVEVHDAASRPMRAITAETSTMVREMQTHLRSLEQEAVRLTEVTQRYEARLAALKGEAAANGRATAAQTAEMKGLQREIDATNGSTARMT